MNNQQKIEARIRELVPELQEKQEVITCKRAWGAWELGTMTSDDFEVTVGYPEISLAHVLQAIDKFEGCSITSSGEFCQQDTPVGFDWNLSKPFADQEEAVKLFIGELLGIK